MSHDLRTPRDAREEQLTVVMLFLEALIGETDSPDVIQLAAIEAMKHAHRMGLDHNTTEDCLARLLAFASERQQRNPLHSMF